MLAHCIPHSILWVICPHNYIMKLIETINSNLIYFNEIINSFSREENTKLSTLNVILNMLHHFIRIVGAGHSSDHLK